MSGYGLAAMDDPLCSMQNFRNLRVWHVAHRLALDVEHCFRPGPCRRIPGLRKQAVEAATSISWNISEGCGKDPPLEFIRFLDTALGSTSELDSQLQYARDAGVLTRQDHGRLKQQLLAVQRMLPSLIACIRRSMDPDSESGHPTN
jgi:four helix bundle protein